MMKSRNELDFDCAAYEKPLFAILQKAQEVFKEKGKLLDRSLRRILGEYPKDAKEIFRRSHLICAYDYFVSQGKMKEDAAFRVALRMKPVRTQSGVTIVTVLTKPFPCPGTCIFCPNDVRMPKSYIANEPGAMRAERNAFDPYLQVYNRLLALQRTGHTVEKVELIILGGTWSFYPRYYQIWFIKRCFDALNDFGVRDGRHEVQMENKFEDMLHPDEDKGEKRRTYNQIVTQVMGGKIDGFFKAYEKATYEELEAVHKINETALCRNVGLVIETRPDKMTPEEMIHFRRLGATKVQTGIQSLNDRVLTMNKRGHTTEATKKAFELMRIAGFKIHGHWMPNLYGSTPQEDIADYQTLFTPPYYPDELKLYPTSIIANTELYDRYQDGSYKPYTREELMSVLSATISHTPRFVRLTRIVRDIPSTEIVAGNKNSNLRETAEQEIKKQGGSLQDIRSREVKNKSIRFEDLALEEICYETTVSTEYFLAYNTKQDDRIAGYLRLSFLHPKICEQNFFEELRGCAMIREVHVYGQEVGLGKLEEGKAQHLGLGTKLMDRACMLAYEAGFKKLAVISAIGTREYYRKRGFVDQGLYLIKNLV